MSVALAGPALVFDAAGRLRSALRIADVEQENALTLVAQAYVLTKRLLEGDE